MNFQGILFFMGTLCTVTNCDILPRFRVDNGIVTATGFPNSHTNLTFVVCENALQHRNLFDADCLPLFDITQNFQLFADAGVVIASTLIDNGATYHMDLNVFATFQSTARNVIFYHFSSNLGNVLDFTGTYFYTEVITDPPTELPTERPTEPLPTEPPTGAPCLCNWQFDAGDIVQYTGTSLPTGMKGEVKCGSATFSDWLLVQWESFNGGSSSNNDFCDCGEISVVKDNTMEFVRCSDVVRVTEAPTQRPTQQPTHMPTEMPTTASPTERPTESPTEMQTTEVQTVVQTEPLTGMQTEAHTEIESQTNEPEFPTCRTCSELPCAALGRAVTFEASYGGVCAASKPPPNNTCPGSSGEKFSFSFAENWCASAGMRLCTKHEYENNVANNSGCSYDRALNWTPDVCSDPSGHITGHWAVPGAVGESREGHATCFSDNESSVAGVRCCADEVVTSETCCVH